VDVPTPLLFAIIVAWGACWGSFLNVVIYRLPNNMSVASPPSHCPACKAQVRAWQNIPVLSWAFLGGRCANCRVAISLRYPAVEMVTAALALAVAMPWVTAMVQGDLTFAEAGGGLVAEHAFVFALIAIALIDADTFMVPDSLSLPLPLLGIGLAFWLGDARGVSWQQAASGALAGGGGLLAVQLGYAALTGREGLGTGDVKLMAGLGAWLGIQALPLVLLAAAIQGLAFAGILTAVQRQRVVEERGLASMRHLALPFGPFLVLAGLQWLLLHRRLAPVVEGWFGGG